MSTWIYLIRDCDTGLYKIGRAKNPRERLRQLIKQDTLLPRPNNFSLVEAWWGKAEDERILHRHLADVRIRGEWFRLLTNPDSGAPAEWPLVTYFIDSPTWFGDEEQTERESRHLLIRHLRALQGDSELRIHQAIQKFDGEF